MTSKDVVNCLKVYFASPAYCFLEQVADGTGARQHRWADAVAMSVWPSRGYDIHGIEVKVSKSDWKNELKQPEKSSAVQQYCQRWWIATPDETIIAPGELPPTWGWMVCNPKGSMKIIIPAPLLPAKPPSVEFVASILRNVQKADENTIEEVRRKAEHKGREDGRGYAADELKRLRETCNEFEAASGIKLTGYADGKGLGEAVTTLHNLKYRVQHIGSAIKACEDIANMLRQVETIHSLIEATKPPVSPEVDSKSSDPLPSLPTW
jgi:hypothetical protein